MTRSSKLQWLPAVLVGLLACGAAAGQSISDGSYDDGYQSGDYARILSEDNGVSLRRSVSDPLERAGVNAPIFPGDTLLTSNDQRAEVQLAGGSLVRVDRETEVVFLALPAPYAEVTDDTILQVAEGVIRVNAQLGADEDFRVDTPAASIHLLGDGDFRIEVSRDGHTWVSSRRGVAEAVGNGGSVLVRSGMRTSVALDGYPLDPEPFNTFVADGFDRWVEERDGVIRRAADYGSRQGDIYEELPVEVQPYYGELSRGGTWYVTSDYGRVWAPTVVDAGWRPYRHGYWHYGPRGYFWVSYESWGWAPYHYGRWSYLDSYGWCWIPGRVFGGAWVAWSWGSAYVGWGPLNYYNQPHYWGGHHHHYANHRYYDKHSWTFVHADHVARRHVTRHAVPVDRIRDNIRDSVVTTRAPRIPPREVAGSHQARLRGMKQARENVTARVRPGGKSARGSGTTLAQLEKGFSPKRSRNLNARASSGAKLDGQRFNSRPRSAGDATRRSTVRDRAPTDRRLDGNRNRSRTDRAPARRVNAGNRDATQRSLDRARPESTDRRRDLYRRMAAPRGTRERDGGDADARDRRVDTQRPSRRDDRGTTTRAPSRRDDARDRAVRPSRTPTRNSGGERARPTTPRRTSDPKARPSDTRNKGGSKARPSTPRRQSDPKVNRPSTRSSTTRTRPSTTRRSTTPKARPSTPRRSTTPKARPSTPRRSTTPKARPSTPRRSTTPKARSSSRSSSGSKSRSSSGRSSGGSRGGGKRGGRDR